MIHLGEPTVSRMTCYWAWRVGRNRSGSLGTYPSSSEFVVRTSKSLDLIVMELPPLWNQAIGNYPMRFRCTLKVQRAVGNEFDVRVVSVLFQVARAGSIWLPGGWNVTWKNQPCCSSCKDTCQYFWSATQNHEMKIGTGSAYILVCLFQLEFGDTKIFQLKRHQFKKICLFILQLSYKRFFCPVTGRNLLASFTQGVDACTIATGQKHHAIYEVVVAVPVIQRNDADVFLTHNVRSVASFGKGRIPDFLAFTQKRCTKMRQNIDFLIMHFAQ